VKAVRYRAALFLRGEDVRLFMPRGDDLHPK
jgi:hypothetical protein